MVARGLPWIKNYKHIASFIETKKDLRTFVGLVFSPTTFGRSDEPFIIYSCLSPKSSDICPCSLGLTPYASDLKTLFSQKVAKQLAICLVSGLSLFLLLTISRHFKKIQQKNKFFLSLYSICRIFIFFQLIFFPRTRIYTYMQFFYVYCLLLIYIKKN